MDSILNKWKIITGNDNISYSDQNKVLEIKCGGLIDLDRIKCYQLFEKDRNDTNDWMPFREHIPGHLIRVFYINTNIDSKNYNNYLIMEILCGGTGPSILVEYDKNESIIFGPTLLE